MGGRRVRSFALLARGDRAERSFSDQADAAVDGCHAAPPGQTGRCRGEVRPGLHRPRAAGTVIAAGEAVTPAFREAWGCKVLDLYATTETRALAVESPGQGGRYLRPRCCNGR